MGAIRLAALSRLSDAGDGEKPPVFGLQLDVGLTEEFPERRRRYPDFAARGHCTELCDVAFDLVVGATNRLISEFEVAGSAEFTKGIAWSILFV